MMIHKMFVSAAVANKRSKICGGCDRNFAGVCGECKCLVAAKVRVAATNCPLGKWEEAPAKLQQPHDVRQQLKNGRFQSEDECCRKP